VHLVFNLSCNQALLSKQMTDVFKQTQSAYDQIVLEFAKRNHASLDGNLLALAQKLIQHVGQNGHIIEIGCGTGRDMAYFESQGIAVTGLDLSAGMLAYARQQVRGGLAVMNMCHLGFRDAHFEGAWSCASLLHVPKQEAPTALQDIQRVLKPGGMLILSIQEGNTESWEEGYVSGIKRFFARYQADEMKSMLSNNRFSVRDVGSSHGNNRDWLSFICLGISG
jgi:ubiquinone/menaquinone biosynthesis C-methylase UbiE